MSVRCHRVKRARCALFLSMFGTCVSAPMLSAQPNAAHLKLSWRPSSDSAVIRADAFVSAGDTAQAIETLEKVLLPRSTNAAAWHRYGILKWQSVRSQRSAMYIGDANVIASLRLADSALRLATKFAPDSAEYWVTLGRFNLQSNIGSMRFAAEQQMQRGFDVAAARADSSLMAETSHEQGMAIWRRFESTRNRALVGAGNRVQFQTDSRWQRAHAKSYLETFAKKIEPPTGADDYAAAMTLFRRALSASPSTLRYSHRVYMGLAVGKQWEALLSLANSRATMSPFDADARLARGLALHRLRRTREAKLAFDTASALMEDEERAYLFRIDRILPSGPNVLTGERGMDQATFAAMPSAQRAMMSAIFWKLNDPIGTTVENEAELEFMSRVVQADWQWTDAIQGVRGIETDRADIFVRYGPPDDEMTLLGISSVQQDVSASGGIFTLGGLTGGMMATSQDVGSTLAWIYRSGDVFFFDIAPGFGTARTPLTDQKHVAEVSSVKPASWDNFSAPRRVDSLPARITRFRGPGDSTDVVIAARIPLRALVADTTTSLDSAAVGGSVRVDLSLVDGAARLIARDSSKSVMSKDSLTSGARSWTRRIRSGPAFVRINGVHTAADSDVQRQANAIMAVEAPVPSGFGVSDVLLTTVGGSSNVSATRWRELGVTPSVGVYRVGEKVGMAWETYELAASAQDNRYRVAITVERTKRSGASGIALRVLDGVGALLKQGSGSPTQMTVSFDRNVKAQATQLDYFILDWVGDARGEYRLRLDITDLVTNKVATRETRLRIH